jgi:hypothetical protein
MAAIALASVTTIFTATANTVHAQSPAPRFNVLVIAELHDPRAPDRDEIHRPFVEAAKIWLDRLAADSGSATITRACEEWYVWDRSPRGRVHVLASVDETTYELVDPSQRGIRLGDHPVVWTNDGLAGRNLYVFMGHHPNLFANAAYTTLLTSSIMWLANGPATPRR